MFQNVYEKICAGEACEKFARRMRAFSVSEKEVVEKNYSISRKIYAQRINASLNLSTSFFTIKKPYFPNEKNVNFLSLCNMQ